MTGASSGVRPRLMPSLIRPPLVASIPLLLCAVRALVRSLHLGGLPREHCLSVRLGLLPPRVDEPHQPIALVSVPDRVGRTRTSRSVSISPPFPLRTVVPADGVVWSGGFGTRFVSSREVRALVECHARRRDVDKVVCL